MDEETETEEASTGKDSSGFSSYEFLMSWVSVVVFFVAATPLTVQNPFKRKA